MDQRMFEVFKLTSEGFCCSQIMLKLVLDMEEKINEDLLRAIGGFCVGIGGSQRECGVLTGGIAILGLYAGKGKAGEWTKDNYGTMVKDYMAWFEERFDSVDCIDLVGVFQFTDSNNTYPVKCGDVLLESFTKILEILEENGYTVGNREMV